MPQSVTRHRVHVGMTLHPDTVTRLDALATRFRVGRGVIVDKMANVVERMYASGKLHCAHGQVCQIGRTDVPEVL